MDASPDVEVINLENQTKRTINPNDLIVASIVHSPGANSDLNEFIKQNLRVQEIIPIEYDGLFLIVNVAKKSARLIEFQSTKHAQLSALRILHYAMNHLGRQALLADNYASVEGNYPFDNAEISTSRNTSITVSQQQLLNWLNFKKDIDETIKKQESQESIEGQ